jgi:nitrite reductase/ring-hydroxylating ferredoxin subunit
MSEEFVKVGQVTDFPPGSKKKVQVGSEDVLVANVAGKIYAISNECTHKRGSLDEGELEGTVVTCPLHSGQFDITTGKVLRPPPPTKNETSFEVLVQGTDVLLKKRLT